MAHAYQQIPLDESSKKLVVINTQKGLFQYNRLPLGVSSAPSIFQCMMEGILKGIPHVSVYLDDILVTGNSPEEHLSNLEVVLTRLKDAGLRLKKKKCAFMLEVIEYLGHKISADGLAPTEEKVRAVNDAHAPLNVSQLCAFWGLVNYYGKFLPKLSSILASLYNFLKKKEKWMWAKPQEEALLAIKKQLTAACLLTHFDPDKEVVLACDASLYGIGAVLSHRTEEGEKPIAYASCSLLAAEKKYA